MRPPLGKPARPGVSGLVAAGFLLVLAAGITVGAGAAPRPAQASQTPASLPTAAPRPTPSPTPRVLVIAEVTPTRTPQPPSPTPTATATAPPTSSPAPTAPPTAIPSPTAPPVPTATPTPPPAESFPPPPPPAETSPPSPDPNQVSTSAASSRLLFAAEDWVGGYYQGGNASYGRPWVAVYGALSPYPRAALAFDLDAAPAAPATLTLTGLDDEWADANGIVVEVNGVPVYAGPSPFPNWDGVGSGDGAAWAAVPFAVPAEALRAGRNEVAVSNQSPSASVGLPPYVLLADASLEVASGAVAGAPPPLDPARPLPAAPVAAPALALRLAFAAADWDGGYFRGDALAYGRPWVAVYGARSPYPRAVLRFSLEAAPAGTTILALTGLDDEWAGPNEIAVEVNGVTVYAGPGPFADWDGVGTGEDAAWTRARFELPAGLLRAGENEVAVSNLADAAGVGVPPYVLLAEATLRTPGADRSA